MFIVFIILMMNTIKIIIDIVVNIVIVYFFIYFGYWLDILVYLWSICLPACQSVFVF